MNRGIDEDFSGLNHSRAMNILYGDHKGYIQNHDNFDYKYTEFAWIRKFINEYNIKTVDEYQIYFINRILTNFDFGEADTKEIEKSIIGYDEPKHVVEIGENGIARQVIIGIHLLPNTNSTKDDMLKYIVKNGKAFKAIALKRINDNLVGNLLYNIATLVSSYRFTLIVDNVLEVSFLESEVNKYL